MNRPKLIRYRSVHWVKLGRTVGTEIYKTFPYVVMSNDQQNALGKRAVVIPLTTPQYRILAFIFQLNLIESKVKFYPSEFVL
jgi:mRNA-degrading endonuclease toxin of MazEF toxin-antitoxin module